MLRMWSTAAMQNEEGNLFVKQLNMLLSLRNRTRQSDHLEGSEGSISKGDWLEPKIVKIQSNACT